MASPVEIFCCYSRKDQDLLQGLKTHLATLQRQGLITVWADADIIAGAEWEHEIDKHLNTAQIILLLISPDFIASEYCYNNEMKQALERHERGEACVIPIICRYAYWRGTPFAKLQALPTNAKPILSRYWRNKDEAFSHVAENIYKIVEHFLSFRLSQQHLTHFFPRGNRKWFECRWMGQNRAVIASLNAIYALRKSFYIVSGLNLDNEVVSRIPRLIKISFDGDLLTEEEMMLSRNLVHIAFPGIAILDSTNRVALHAKTEEYGYGDFQSMAGNF